MSCQLSSVAAIAVAIAIAIASIHPTTRPLSMSHPTTSRAHVRPYLSGPAVQLIDDIVRVPMTKAGMRWARR